LSSTSLETQEILILFCCLPTSTLAGAVDFMTQSSALTGSAIAYQSSTSGLPSTPSLGTCPWYLDSGASFHMAPHSVNLSSMRSSYHHLAVQIADGSPLFVAGQGTLCSNSFYIADVSLVPDLTMQLMSAEQITDHDCCVILDPDFCYIQNYRTGHLVGTGPQCRDSHHLCDLDWLHLPSAAPTSLSSPTVAASSMSSFSQWHHRLDHLCGSRLSALLH
jgi:hypothetical protein